MALECSFKNFPSEYIGAEITCVFLHDKVNDIAYNLLTVIELVPVGQEASPLISPEKTAHLQRLNRGLKDITIFIGRAIGLDVQKAVNTFNDITKGFDLIQGATLNRRIEFFPNVELMAEPPGGNPLLMNKTDGKNHAEILPYRNGDFRVWSKIDMTKSWQLGYSHEELDKILGLAGELTMEHMRLDLKKFREHVGNAYMIAPNPILRKIGFTLMDDQKKVMASFFPREGKRIIGGKMLLIEDRMLGNGFAVETKINANRVLLELPYVPKLLMHYIFAPNGTLIEHGSSSWMNINFQMNIQERDLRVTLNTPKGTKVIQAKKYTAAQEVKVGRFDYSGARYFSDYQENRKHEALASSKEFIFFTGHPTDKVEASKVIKELLSKARHRCIILDPYFSAADLEYAIGVPNLGVDVWVISSVAFLSEKVDRDIPEVKHAHQLKEAVDQYLTAYGRQTILFRLLEGGNRSPLHDRYIVIDDDVYLLGSSLNEFGSRATCLIKVPAPKPLIQKATDWWNTGTIDLNSYVAHLATCQ
ncbi:MAG: hypothetical protein EOO90_17925 [Pedobacter sp.]|nr:MAG: hypothetical protein EOO90_17925 [Pedobacter sp.]